MRGTINFTQSSSSPSTHISVACSHSSQIYTHARTKEFFHFRHSNTCLCTIRPCLGPQGYTEPSHMHWTKDILLTSLRGRQVVQPQSGYFQHLRSTSWAV
mmetsp:Transcript_76449/g.135009  ORF Transcript_76449/g.135009 Transcript_76449/m.135009 type:complete len:100 (-) Transcript_76449:20-319(-)